MVLATLTWDGFPDNTSYVVEYKIDNGGTIWTEAPGSPTTSTTLSFLVEELEFYNFRVRGYCGAETDGGYIYFNTISGTSSSTTSTTTTSTTSSTTTSSSTTSTSTSSTTSSTTTTLAPVTTTTSTSTSSTTTSTTSTSSTSTSTTTLPVTTSTSTTTSTTTTTLPSIPDTGNLVMNAQNNITLGTASYNWDTALTNNTTTNARAFYSPAVAKNGGTGTVNYAWNNSDGSGLNNLVPITEYYVGLTSASAGVPWTVRVYFNGVLVGTGTATGTGQNIILTTTLYPQDGDILLGVLSDT